MTKDNFKDEFEKNKQPVERQDDLNNDDLVFEGEDFANQQEGDDFPPRGVSRRNRSERRRREDSPDESSESLNSKKKRRRKGAAAGAATTAAVSHEEIEHPAQADEVKTTTFVAGDGEPNVHHVDEDETEHEEKKNKWLPLLAILLILIPILFLLFMWLGNRDDKDANEKATTEQATTEQTTEKATTEVPATAENTTESVTTEEVTTENPTTEATTEVPTTEKATTEAPSANRGGTTHTVGANENLYRIAIRYYGNGSPANVEKIRKANGLSGNNLTIGQKLEIPK